jgi:hypothetical protein
LRYDLPVGTKALQGLFTIIVPICAGFAAYFSSQIQLSGEIGANAAAIKGVQARCEFTERVVNSEFNRMGVRMGQVETRLQDHVNRGRSGLPHTAAFERDLSVIEIRLSKLEQEKK